MNNCRFYPIDIFLIYQLILILMFILLLTWSIWFSGLTTRHFFHLSGRYLTGGIYMDNSFTAKSQKNHKTKTQKANYKFFHPAQCYCFESSLISSTSVTSPNDTFIFSRGVRIYSRDSSPGSK